MAWVPDIVRRDGFEPLMTRIGRGNHGNLKGLVVDLHSGQISEIQSLNLPASTRRSPSELFRRTLGSYLVFTFFFLTSFFLSHARCLSLVLLL